MNEYGTTLISKNISVGGQRTSVRLEPEMWQALSEVAKREQCSQHDLATLISYKKNANTSLTSALRVFLMLYYKAAATPEGHVKANHGNIQYMRERAYAPKYGSAKKQA